MPKLTPGLNPIPLALHEVSPYCRHADLMSKQAQFKRLKIFSTSIQSKMMRISWTSWENPTKRNPHPHLLEIIPKHPQKMKNNKIWKWHGKNINRKQTKSLQKISICGSLVVKVPRDQSGSWRSRTVGTCKELGKHWMFILLKIGFYRYWFIFRIICSGRLAP